MKKNWWIAVIFVWLLTLPVSAVKLPEELTDVLPREAEDFMKGLEFDGADPVGGGVAQIFARAAEQLRGILRQRLKNTVAVLMTALLCGMVSGFRQGTGPESGVNVTLMAGALTVTMLTVGTLDMLVDMGRQTIEDISIFSKALLPTLAAVTAASGAIGTASVHQVATAFFVDMLLQLIRGILLPMVYLYIGVMVAGTMLSDGRLNGVAAALKKVVVWVLSTSLLIFTLYLSVTKVISGTTDSATLKVTKAAISGVVPVVGSILSDAAETVLSGAGILKGTVGVFGMLAVLAICIQPFLQLGTQYLLYKLAAFLAAMAAPPALCKLIDGLGTTFGLVLGMTGACGVLLLVSIVSFVTAVTP